jgi:hypothetical protein
MEWLLKTKADLMKMLEKSRVDLEQAKLDVGVWEMMVDDVDAEIAEIQEEERQKKRLADRLRPLILLITASVIITMVVGCGTLEGLPPLSSLESSILKQIQQYLRESSNNQTAALLFNKE